MLLKGHISPRFWQDTCSPLLHDSHLLWVNVQLLQAKFSIHFLQRIPKLWSLFAPNRVLIIGVAQSSQEPEIKTDPWWCNECKTTPPHSLYFITRTETWKVTSSSWTTAARNPWRTCFEGVSRVKVVQEVTYRTPFSLYQNNVLCCTRAGFKQLFLHWPIMLWKKTFIAKHGKKRSLDHIS